MLVENLQYPLLATPPVDPWHVHKRQFVFLGQGREIWSVTDHHHRLSLLELPLGKSLQQRLRAPILTRDHDSHPLFAARLGDTQAHLHAEFLAQRIELTFERGGRFGTHFPRCLDDHAELAACDLFLQGLNVGLLLKEKLRHPRHHTGFIPADHGNGCKTLHGRASKANGLPQSNPISGETVDKNFIRPRTIALFFTLKTDITHRHER